MVLKILRVLFYTSKNWIRIISPALLYTIATESEKKTKIFYTKVHLIPSESKVFSLHCIFFNCLSYENYVLTSVSLSIYNIPICLLYDSDID